MYLLKANSSKLKANGGQVMLLTVLVLSGTILGATTIAGLLTLYQIRGSTDFINSAKAVYAADSGIEWRLYKFFKADNQVCKDCPDGEACPSPAMTDISSPLDPIKASCETIPGAVTFKTIPGAVTSVSVKLYGGGGGGGGGGATAGWAVSGGGGGGGGYVIENITGLTPGTVIPVTVGSGGNAGAHNTCCGCGGSGCGSFSGYAGGNGGNSTFGSYATAYGGIHGGSCMAAGAGGGGLGDSVYYGGDGGGGSSSSGQSGTDTGGSGGNGGDSSNPTYGKGGSGGSANGLSCWSVDGIVGSDGQVIIDTGSTDGIYVFTSSGNFTVPDATTIITTSTTTIIKSTGISGNSSRAFEITLQ